MTNPIGPLLPADEQLGHQIADTFATVATSDPSWTEKICAMAMARDGSVQVGFGLGKYTNRNVMDGYAALSRGAEQVTVRASRRLAPPNSKDVVSWSTKHVRWWVARLSVASMCGSKTASNVGHRLSTPPSAGATKVSDAIADAINDLAPSTS